MSMALRLAVLTLMVVLGACSDEGGDGDSAGTPPADQPSSTTTTPEEEPSATGTSATSPAPGSFVLEPDRVGPVGLGMEEEAAMVTLTDLLGPSDSDNVLPPGSCSTGATRSVSWGDLNVFFGPGAGGETTAVGWTYGTDDLPAAPPASTTEGISAGSTRAELQAAYGDRLEVTEETEAGAVRFVISGAGAGGEAGGISGLLTGSAATDTVRGLFAGSYCG